MLGLNLASLEVTKWEDEAASGPEAVASPTCRKACRTSRGRSSAEWSYQQAFHSEGLRGLQILARYWWPRFVATIGQSRGHGVIDQVIWIDAPGDHAERVFAAAREAFRVR